MHELSTTSLAMRDDLGRVLGAYVRLADGDPMPLIALLDDEVVWDVTGGSSTVGRANVARKIQSMPAGIELVGAKLGATVAVLEFSRPWWKTRNRRAALVGVDLHGEQSVFVKNGRIARIDSRQRASRGD